MMRKMMARVSPTKVCDLYDLSPLRLRFSEPTFKGQSVI
jgi:hypothetical protein